MCVPPVAESALCGPRRGVLDVMEVVRQRAARDAGTSVLFLTPCHATPFYSHVHAPIRMRFLDCSPLAHAPGAAALNAAETAWLALPTCPAGVERLCFEQAPAQYLAGVLELNGRGVLPTMLVLYSPAARAVAHVAAVHGYVEDRRLTNCWAQTDDDTFCELVVLSRRAAGE